MLGWILGGGVCWRDYGKNSALHIFQGHCFQGPTTLCTDPYNDHLPDSVFKCILPKTELEIMMHILGSLFARLARHTAGELRKWNRKKKQDTSRKYFSAYVTSPPWATGAHYCWREWGNRDIHLPTPTITAWELLPIAPQRFSKTCSLVKLKKTQIWFCHVFFKNTYLFIQSANTY